MCTEYLQMEKLTQFERIFIEVLRSLSEEQRTDVLKIMEALRKSIK